MTNDVSLALAGLQSSLEMREFRIL